MQFTLSALGALMVATAVALPQDELAHQRPFNILHPAPDGMTVEEASQKCGDKAQLSCCNDATYTGDDTQVSSGLGSGLVSDALGAGAGSQGIGLFSGCSELPLSINVLLIAGVTSILNQECKENVACCQKSGGSADDGGVGLQLPCVGLGSII